MSELAAFHFLRPGWLLLLLPAAWVIWSIQRRQDPLRRWKAVIAPGLLESLLLESDERESRLRPAYLVAAAWVLAIVALAGPTWRKEATPFTQDRAALFLVLKVTPGMLAQDIQPSRLQRAVQKIGDLLETRPGTRTGLIAYAATAHLVVPLTSDAGVIDYFAPALTPGVMPEADQGLADDPVAAVRLAARRLKRASVPGSIVLIADAIEPSAAPGLKQVAAESGSRITVYAVAAGPEVLPPPGSPPAPPLDEGAMKRVARAAGGGLVVVTPDDSDLAALNQRIESSISAAPAQEGERWQDPGYWFVPLFVLLVLPFFRRGGAVALKS